MSTIFPKKENFCQSDRSRNSTQQEPLQGRNPPKISLLPPSHSSLPFELPFETLARPHEEPLPLGTPLPNSPHALSCSLPTIKDVIGYEERQPATLQSILQGYPRFVNHYLTQKLERHLWERLLSKALPGHRLRLISSPFAFERLYRYLRKYLGGRADIRLQEEQGGRQPLYCVIYPNDLQLERAIGHFLQYTGLMLFSREAEDHLLARGLAEGSREENSREAGSREESSFEGEGAAERIRELLAQYHNTGRENIWLCRSGMSAFFAALLALQELQAWQGRHIWIQLGWLYSDTIELLRAYTHKSRYIQISDATDLKALRRLLQERGDQIAGVVAEFPTNPLLKSPPLEHLSHLCRRQGVALLLDPTLASAYNLRCLPWVDIIFSSLSKYYACCGDVIMGMLALNPHSPFYDQLRQRLPHYAERPYLRDIRRLATEIGSYPLLMERINCNTARLARFLQRHPAVRRIYWAYSEDVAANYQAIGTGPGGLISMELKGSLSRFYDRIQLAKGPSFGFSFTLLCPFIYLAHYNLLRSPKGRSCLRANGISPQLIRISVGAEAIEFLEAAFAAAL